MLNSKARNSDHSIVTIYNNIIKTFINTHTPNFVEYSIAKINHIKTNNILFRIL